MKFLHLFLFIYRPRVIFFMMLLDIAFMYRCKLIKIALVFCKMIRFSVIYQAALVMVGGITQFTFKTFYPQMN